MMGFRDAAGFVLVGGRSSRMGADKALLPYAGLPLASHIAAQLAPVVDEVCFVGGDPVRYAGLGRLVLPDLSPGAGPVGGIVTALRHSRSTWNLVTACDLPAVKPALFEEILDRIRASAVQCLVPVTPDGKEQVLCAAYRRDAVEGLSAALEEGDRKLRSAVRRLDTVFWRVEMASWPANLNTPEDWAFHARQEA